MPTPYRSPWATDEHELFRATVRDFAARELLPHEERFIAQGHIDPEVWTRAGEAGLLGCDIPAEHGGTRWGLRARVRRVRGDLAHRGSPGSARPCTRSRRATSSTTRTDEQKSRWLPGSRRASNIWAIAMSEPGTGSDLQAVKTRAVRDGDEYVINGSKTFITNGINCDHSSSSRKTDKDAGSTRACR